MDFAMRTVGLPSIGLWEVLLPHKHSLIVHDDNSAMIRVVETGWNPTMRYLHRTHRVSVAWLHEQLEPGRDGIELIYEDTNRMAADIFTKAFTNREKWEHAHELINAMRPDAPCPMARTSLGPAP